MDSVDENFDWSSGGHEKYEYTAIAVQEADLRVVIDTLDMEIEQDNLNLSGDRRAALRRALAAFEDMVNAR